MSTVIERAIAWARAIAADAAHGYDQSSRWGPDYDCSSFVISAYRSAGLALPGATYTGNMRAVFCSCGFAWLPASTPLRAGDVLLHERNHTALYIGNGQIIHAAGNERGGATGGIPGDQTGREICVAGYYVPSYGWDGILRYTGEETPETSAPAAPSASPAEEGLYTVQSGDTLWGIAERYLGAGARWHDLYEINDLQSIDLFPGQVLRLRKDADEPPEPESAAPAAPDDEITALARAVIRGEYGNGLERVLKLGTKYRAVQAEVNRLLSGNIV
ncbi:MAG: LysM peptidoglycan-binding domain-containing protein [Oscillibacter sp.]|nr:LysM peptidoglycan-binding domain-containing protein [Oscillibacter sp.]